MQSRFEKWFRAADDVDRREGAKAYHRYREVMEFFAELYGFPVDRVTAAFVALSPNTDYLSNLRSLVSVLAGVRDEIEPTQIIVSTYNHNKMRAISYLTGEARFDVPTRGRKILSFYDNILRPDDSIRVTVDGHMVAIWRDQNITMKEAAIRGTEYRDIEDEVRRFAFYHQIVPCQMQAILWFTRKRLLGIKYNPQLSLFEASDDQWGTLAQARDLQPYGRKEDGSPPAERQVLRPGAQYDGAPALPLQVPVRSDHGLRDLDRGQGQGTGQDPLVWQLQV